MVKVGEGRVTEATTKMATVKVDPSMEVTKGNRAVFEITKWEGQIRQRSAPQVEDRPLDRPLDRPIDRSSYRPSEDFRDVELNNVDRPPQRPAPAAQPRTDVMIVDRSDAAGETSRGGSVERLEDRVIFHGHIYAGTKPIARLNIYIFTASGTMYGADLQIRDDHNTIIAGGQVKDDKITFSDFPVSEAGENVAPRDVLRCRAILKFDDQSIPGPNASVLSGTINTETRQSYTFEVGSASDRPTKRTNTTGFRE
jgi:hypothetical protein